MEGFVSVFHRGVWWDLKTIRFEIAADPPYAKFFKEKNSLDQPHKENNEVILKNMLSYVLYGNVNPASIAHNIRVPFQGKSMVKMFTHSESWVIWTLHAKLRLLCLDMNLVAKDIMPTIYNMYQ